MTCGTHIVEKMQIARQEMNVNASSHDLSTSLFPSEGNEGKFTKYEQAQGAEGSFKPRLHLRTLPSASESGLGRATLLRHFKIQLVRLMMITYNTQPLLREQRQGEATTIGNCATLESGTHQDSIRAQVRQCLTSKLGHYAILLLVSLDVACIFGDLLIGLFICEQACSTDPKAGSSLEKAKNAFGIVSLVFSCLFMAELIASIWAFDFKYICFKSRREDLSMLTNTWQILQLEVPLL